MKLFQRLQLIKAGYTKAEIAEMEAAELVQDPEPEEPETTEEPEEPEAPEEPEPEPDYKALYLKAKSDLEAAQHANRQTPVKTPEPVDLDKELEELTKRLF